MQSLSHTRSCIIDPDFKVNSTVWSISLIRAHGDRIKEPEAILVIDGERPPMNTPKSNIPAFELPIMLNFGQQSISWWSPKNCLNVIDRAAGKTDPVSIGEEELDQLKSEPTYIQKTWSIARVDALEFIYKVQHREKLHVQFLT